MHIICIKNSYLKLKLFSDDFYNWIELVTENYIFVCKKLLITSLNKSIKFDIPEDKPNQRK